MTPVIWKLLLNGNDGVTPSVNLETGERKPASKKSKKEKPAEQKVDRFNLRDDPGETQDLAAGEGQRTTSPLCRLLQGRAKASPVSEPVSTWTMPMRTRSIILILVGFALLLPALQAERAAEPIFLPPGINDVKAAEACVIGELHPQSERFYVRLGNYGKSTPLVAQTWDASRHTGLQVPAGFQFGPLAADASTAVQVRGREIGIWIDSDHPRPALGSLLPVCPGYWWWDLSRAPAPFREPGRELSLTFDLRVPTASQQGKADVYISTNFLFRDTRSKQQFWLAAILFDPRGEARFPDTVHVDNWEGGTHLPILFSALNHRSQWLHPGPGSALYAGQPFTGYRPVSVRVTAAGLRTAIAAMREAMPNVAAASEDPRDYQLIHFNINPEVSAPQGSRGRLGLSLRGIRVELLAP